MQSPDIVVEPSGTLTFRGKQYRCSLGQGGITNNKREGDKATPTGRYQLRELFYRPDKFSAPPKTSLPSTALTPDDAWSDDPAMPEYNTHIKLPAKGSYENLWRKDYLYDLIVPISYNDDPIVPGKGSGIFIHVAREGYTGTYGCIGLAKEDLLEILADIKPTTRIQINE